MLLRFREYGRKKLKDVFSSKNVFFLLILILITLILYWDYIFGSKVYVFNDIAGDSFHQIAPSNLNLAYEIDIFGRIPSWNWSYFLGTAQSTGFDVFNSWIYMFGPENVGRMLGFMQVFKIILAGLIFYIYTKMVNFSYYTRVLTSIGYAFCGHMIARGAWSFYPIEVLCVAMLLVGLEFTIANKKKGMVFFAVSISIIAIYGSAYRGVLYAGISLGYVFFRMVEINCSKLDMNILKRTFFLILIGLGVAAFAFLPSLFETLASSRVSTALINSASNEASMTFFSDIKVIYTCILRMFSNDLAGTALDYAGALNYLEGPAFYSGTLIILGIPFAFSKKHKAKTLLYAITLFITMLYCLVQPIRLIANAFDSATFKLSSFWIIVVLLYVGGRGLNNLFGDRFYKKKIMIYIVSILLVFSIITLYDFELVNKGTLLMVLLFLIAYFICIVTLKKPASKKKRTLILIFIIEIIMLSYPAINTRKNFSKDSYNSIFMNAEFKTLIDELKQGDNDLFRIEYPNMDFGNPLKYHYMGTKAYIGGSAYTEHTKKFISSISNDYMEQLGYSRKVYGFYGNVEISSFIGSKYLFLDKGTEYQYVPHGYKLLKESDNYLVFENELALPIFTSYSDTINTENFYQLEKKDRRISILEKLVILEGTELLSDSDTENYLDSNEVLTQIQNISLPASEKFIFPIPQPISDSIILNMKVSTKAQEMQAISLYIEWGDLPSEKMNYITATGKEDIVIEIPYSENLDEIIISSNYKGDLGIDELEILSNGSDYYEYLENSINDRKESNIQITNFEGDKVELIADMQKNDKYLFASIPYDEGWEAYVDGKPVEIVNANVGFMAIPIEEGVHNITLKYDNRTDSKWYLISFISICLLFLYYKSDAIKYMIKKRGRYI